MKQYDDALWNQQLSVLPRTMYVTALQCCVQESDDVNGNWSNAFQISNSKEECSRFWIYVPMERFKFLVFYSYFKSIVTTAFRKGASIVIDDVNVSDNGLWYENAVHFHAHVCYFCWW